MIRIEQFNPKKGSRISELIGQFSKMGGTARELAEACEVSEKMVRDRECLKFLSMSGAAVPMGLKELVCELIEKKWCDVIVTNGANIVHDVMDAYGAKHYACSHCVNDVELHKKGMGRVGNVVVSNKGYEVFEKEMKKIFWEISEEKEVIGISEMMEEIGKWLPENSFVNLAQKKGVRIYSPGFQDSMLGLQLMMFRQKRKLVVDAALDMDELVHLTYDAKRTGALMLGGGVPKHYAMGANILRGGLDYAVNITTGSWQDNSLSGAPLSEGKSWGKAGEKAETAIVRGDYSAYFPMLMGYLREKVE